MKKTDGGELDHIFPTKNVRENLRTCEAWIALLFDGSSPGMVLKPGK